MDSPRGRRLESSDRLSGNLRLSSAMVRVYRSAQSVLERLSVSPTFVKFLIVGGIGYLVNQFVLFTLYDSPVASLLPDKGTHLDLGFLTISDVTLLIASTVAVEAAIASNFYWHQRWTFRDREFRRPLPIRFLAFHLTSMGSPVISLVAVNVLSPLFGLWPYFSNTIGICLGALWNWTWNTLVIWPKQHNRAHLP